MEDKKKRIPPFPKGTFLVRSLHTGNYFDTSGASKKSGTPLIVWPYNGGQNQNFNFKPEKEGSKYGTITSGCSGKVLECHGSNNVDHQKLKDPIPDTQLWYYDGASFFSKAKAVEKSSILGVSYDISHSKSNVDESKMRDIAMDVKGNSTKEGANVICYLNMGGLNQEWELISVTTRRPWQNPYDEEDDGEEEIPPLSAE